MSTVEIIFIGTGTSEGVPRVSCLTNQTETCFVCSDAMKPNSRNRRRNTSIALRFKDTRGEKRLVLIDVGKFFYHSALEWFPKFNLSVPDAVVLTHAHADAAGGLDDLRDWTKALGISLPVYARNVDREALSKTAYYLVDRSQAYGGGMVAMLDFIFTDGCQPFEPADGLSLQPLEVEHGKGFTSNGYRFGDVCYVPDVSAFPPETWQKMQGCKLLILDVLRRRRTYGSHFTLEQALEKTLELAPRRALFVGMSHELEHSSINAELAELKTHGIDAALAYDGLSLQVEI